MNRRTPTVDPATFETVSFGAASSGDASDLLSDLPGSDVDAPLDPTASAGEHPAEPDGSLLIPTIWQRFRYWAWHPVSRSSLAVLLVAGLLPLLLSFTQHLSAVDVTGPTEPVVTQPVVTVPITVPVTIAVPVTVTSTPPAPTTGTAAAPAPVTVVRTTVLTTVQTTVQTTGGTKPSAATMSALRPLVGPNVGTKAAICFTPATLQITATGKGVVNLNVTGAATAHKSGRGSAKMTVTGRTGTYAITAASTGGSSTIRWSALRGACS